MLQLNLFNQQNNIRKNLSNNLDTNRYSIHRWYNFIAGFSPEFVKLCIEESKIGHDNIVIDPFSGLSTTLTEANFNNVFSIGFEAHPFFHEISKAKIFPPKNTNVVENLENELLSVEPGNLREFNENWSNDSTTFLLKIIPEDNLRFLINTLSLEQNIPKEHRSLFRLIVSRVLEYSSGSQTDGIYKAPTSRKKSISYHNAVSLICKAIKEDIEYIGEDNFISKAKLYYGSSENMSLVESASCSLCITSPPYLNNFDFAEMTRMELYFWKYASSWREITEKVRRNLIVNTTTAPTDLKRNQEVFSAAFSESYRMRVMQPLIDALIEERKHRSGKKDYYLLIYPYFAQMQNVIRELRRILKYHSSLHLVVADAALYGVYIPTQEILKDLMVQNGFEIISLENLRKRGERWILQKRKGSNNLGEYHIYARRI